MLAIALVVGIQQSHEFYVAAQEYKEWATVSRKICTSFINKLGVPLSEAVSDCNGQFTATSHDPGNPNIVTTLI